MVSMILHGCSGHMGQEVTEIAASDPEMEIVAGIDISDLQNRTYPVFTNISDCSVPADVIVDFSTAEAVDALLGYAVERNIPVVLCTTGLSEVQLQNVQEASGKIAILRSANMSLGINLILKLLKEVSGTLVQNGFDPEIVEMHHRRKLDAPSGTAIALADSINEACGGKFEYTYGRSERREKRPENEIGISSVRGGTMAGVHDVIFAGQDEVIEFTHTAYSRAILAKGAVAAARFLAGKAPGLYSMSDVIG